MADRVLVVGKKLLILAKRLPFPCHLAAVDEVDGDQRPFVTDRVPDATMDVGNEPALLEDREVPHLQTPEHDAKARVVSRVERAVPARADREYYSRRDSNPQSSP